MDDATYSTVPNGFAPHRVGGHLRHVIGFYECFLDGLESTRIDYDQRRRDGSIEKSRQAAAARIHFLIRRFEDNPDLQFDSRLAVRMEDSVQAEWLSSSVGRE